MGDIEVIKVLNSSNVQVCGMYQGTPVEVPANGSIILPSHIANWVVSKALQMDGNNPLSVEGKKDELPSDDEQDGETKFSKKAKRQKV